MEQKDLNILKGQCANWAIQILLNSADAPNLRLNKHTHQEIFALTRALVQSAIDSGFPDWKQSDFGNDMKPVTEKTSDVKPCPKCAEPIPVSWSQHFKCGWK